MKMKTNIKCSACVEKVTPSLNALIGENKWRVDLTDVNRTLTIDAPVDERLVNEALAEAGYKGEKTDN